MNLREDTKIQTYISRRMNQVWIPWSDQMQLLIWDRKIMDETYSDHWETSVK